MCGRYTSFTSEEAEGIMNAIRAAEKNLREAGTSLNLKTSGEVFPTNCVPVLLGEQGNLIATFMQWGYPGFGKSKSSVLINTMSETAAQKPTWRDSISSRRCIIPSGGFYEWMKGVGKEKTKLLFRLPSEDTLFMAGIFKSFNFSEDDSMKERFSIMTTFPNSSISDVHNRMPVVLRREELDEWLYGDYVKLYNRQDLELVREAEKNEYEQVSLF